MIRTLTIVALTVTAIAVTAAVRNPSLATGLLTCESGDKSGWMTEQALTDKITAEGWQVNRIKEDGGCWEVYGVTPDGKRAEAYFHPVTGENLLIAQRGTILYRAEGY